MRQTILVAGCESGLQGGEMDFFMKIFTSVKTHDFYVFFPFIDNVLNISKYLYIYISIYYFVHDFLPLFLCIAIQF